MSDLPKDTISTVDAQLDGDAYHQLLSDVDLPGIWGWIDRTSERATRWINPILIKEARQSLKSRQFIATFFLLLVGSLFWMMIGVSSMAPDIYYVPSGDSMLTGYYFLLAIPMIALVPLAAHRSMAAEIDDGTLEMLAITKLSSLRIVTGKLGSAMLQMMVYFAALVPCFAFCYLLRGVDLPMIATVIALIFFVATFLTTVGLMLATLCANRFAGLFMLVAMLGLVVTAEFACAAFYFDELIRGRFYWTGEVVLYVGLFGSIAISSMVLFVKSAAARIAPVTENRSTPLRRIMFAQQLLWVGTIATLALREGSEAIVVGQIFLATYWLLMGALMLAESPEMSVRVQRTLPTTTLGRMFLLWMNPGPGTGFMFATTSCFAGLTILGVFALFMRHNSSFTHPLLSGTVFMGYLLMYLGATRLIVLGLGRRLPCTFALPTITLVALLVAGVAGPSILMTIFTGAPSQSYGIQEFTNWAWMIDELDDSRTMLQIAILASIVGGTLFMINLVMLSRETTYRHQPTPIAVLSDDGSFEMGPAQEPETPLA